MAEHRTQRPRLAPLSFFVVIMLVCILSQLTILPPSRVQAATSTANTTVGQLAMSGDPTFDSDSLANSSSNQFRWLSYPGARLSLNPSPNADPTNLAGPLDQQLSLNAGGWFGTSVVDLPDLVQVMLAPQGSAANSAKTVSTTWYPYKIAFNASYSSPSGSTLSGYDYVSDANATMIRVLQDNATVPTDVVLRGSINGSGGGKWDSTDQALLISDSKYFYALHFVDLRGSELAPVTLVEVPTINGSTWTLTKAYKKGGSLGVSIGVASSSEGSTAAVQRALNAFGSSETATLAKTKATMDQLLRKVPAPAAWGINDIPNGGVTAQQNRNMYYDAWVFLLQTLMNALPEQASTNPYPQVLTGKPSLWNNGSTNDPGTAQWDSLFGMQFLSYLEPETAWQAFMGLMAQVQPDGEINGESLPSRKAETAWILYQNDSNLSYLQTIYPELKSHLQWEMQNPRWIFGGHNYSNEKDVEFAASWVFDVDYAIKIATVLGQTSDVSMWQSEQQTMRNDIQTWFFSDPTQYYEYLNGSGGVHDIGITDARLSLLALSNLPTNELNAQESLFMSLQNPAEQLDGEMNLKMPDEDLVAYGLLDHGANVQAKGFIESVLRDEILAGHFSEVTAASTSGPVAQGVAPSLFSTCSIIELTWMLNGVRIDSGTPTAFSFDTSSWSLPASTATMPTLDDLSNTSAWTQGVATNAQIAVLNHTATVTNWNANYYGYVSLPLTYNVDTFPKLHIRIRNVVNDKWSLKVNNTGNDNDDITLQADTSQTGDLIYDLKGATGWSGTQTFRLKVFAINGSVQFDNLTAVQYTLSDFSNPSAVSDWNVTSNASIAQGAGGSATITNGNNSYGYVAKQVSYNVNQYPYVKIDIPSVASGSSWSLKVNNTGNDANDITLQTDTTQTGVFLYNLKGLTGWRGSQSFQIKLFVIGGQGANFNVHWLNTPVYTLDDFSDIASWHNGSSASISNPGNVGVVTLTNGQAGYDYVSQNVGYNVSDYRQMMITVTGLSSGAKWSLKVNNKQGADIALQSDTSQTGTFTYNLPSISGWSGMQTFQIKLFVIGSQGQTVNVNSIQIGDF